MSLIESSSEEPFPQPLTKLNFLWRFRLFSRKDILSSVKEIPLDLYWKQHMTDISAVLLSLFSTNSSSLILREVVEKIYSTVESLESYMQRKLFPKIQTSSFQKTFACQIQNKTKQTLSFSKFLSSQRFSLGSDLM